MTRPFIKYIRRAAWCLQRRSLADVGKQCPLLFVLSWKKLDYGTVKAHALVGLQGFQA